MLGDRGISIYGPYKRVSQKDHRRGRDMVNYLANVPINQTDIQLLQPAAYSSRRTCRYRIHPLEPIPARASGNYPARSSSPFNNMVCPFG